MFFRKVFPFLLLFSVLLNACSGVSLPGLTNTVKVSIVYGSEKREWLEPLVEEYNRQQRKTPDGAVIQIEAEPMGSIEAVRAIIDGEIQPTVWSPASSVYLPVANAEWRKTHAEDMYTGTPRDLVLSPVVIAMWQPMAETLGYPAKPIGWQDIAELSTNPEGWAAYGYPEWGTFKFGHTHPDFSNSGIVSAIAEVYAGLNKQRGLTLVDLQSAELRQFLINVESSIIHYGSSTGFFAERMFERGPSYLSAAVMYENLIVAQEAKRLSGQVSQIPVVAIYPKEGTFWTNNPYVLLNAPWVTVEQKVAAQDFEAFLLDRPQQLRAIELGFRPADPAIPLTSPLDLQHGVDPMQPQTVLEIPSAEVIAAIQNLWQEVKRPVDLVVVLDTSGSMSGDKINAARASLINFINLFDDRDRVQVMTFNTQITTLSPLSPLGEKRADLSRRVSGIIENGGTSLYDATLAAYRDLQTNGDPRHIRAIVVLSDGVDTDSSIQLSELMNNISSNVEEGGNAIKIFTIAFGDDADEVILLQIAESTGAKQYKSDPKNIQKIYGEISTFF